jgi:NADH-quinone oxidoreductase subunit D
MSEQHIKLPEGSIEKTTTTLNLGPHTRRARCAEYGTGSWAYYFDQQTISYIHRAFEKIGTCIVPNSPLTDRLNLFIPIKYGLAPYCEKLLESNPKRVIISVLSLWSWPVSLIILFVIQLSALIVALILGFCHAIPELIYEIYEGVCGSRLIIGRIGGFEEFQRHQQNCKNFSMNIVY